MNNPKVVCALILIFFQFDKLSKQHTKNVLSGIVTTCVSPKPQHWFSINIEKYL